MLLLSLWSLFGSVWTPLYLLIAIVTLLVVWWRKHLSYWADRGVVHDKPTILYGNTYGLGTINGVRDQFKNIYDKYKYVAPFAGFYYPMRKAAVIFDLYLIKQVLVKDFANFSDRGNYNNPKDDPLSGHLFNLDGAIWRHVRNKISPAFTSAKMKYMFSSVVDVAHECVKVLRKEIEQVKSNGSLAAVEGIEIREIMGRYTTDIIGSSIFGIECNSLQNPETQFRTMGKRVLNQRRHGRIVTAFAQAFPTLARKMRIATTPEDVSEFFLNVVKDTVAYREKCGVKRNDFMSILIELKQQQGGLTLEQIAAQVFLFFIAGYDTSASTMSFVLYELALHEEMQVKAREEIESVLARYDGKLSYESMRELHYLEQVKCEVLRKYSIASVLLRQTIKDYQVPNTKFVLEKGLRIIIPIDAIHRDPDIYPDPERFDPSRFAPEAVAKRHPMTWLPFGDGPRNCIGLRFGQMQATVGLALLLKHFKFTVTPKTKVPLVMRKDTFGLNTLGGIYLHVESIGGGES